MDNSEKLKELEGKIADAKSMKLMSHPDSVEIKLSSNSAGINIWIVLGIGFMFFLLPLRDYFQYFDQQYTIPEYYRENFLMFVMHSGIAMTVVAVGGFLYSLGIDSRIILEPDGFRFSKTSFFNDYSGNMKREDITGVKLYYKSLSDLKTGVIDNRGHCLRLYGKTGEPCIEFGQGCKTHDLESLKAFISVYYNIQPTRRNLPS